MNKRLFVMLLLLVASCSKEAEVSTDFKDLPKAIQQQITDAETKCPTCGISIFMFRYDREIIYASICGGASVSQGLFCNCFMVYYDKDGRLIAYDEAKYTDMNDKKLLIKKLYSCSE